MTRPLSALPLPADPAADDRELLKAGYRPEFRRTLGSFTAFAAGFSYLSILTGIVQYFYLGYREAGPAFVWTWPVVLAGQFTLALVFADLAREYPLCGGVYAWSRRTGSAALGWLTGWVYLASLVVTLAAVALAWQIVLPALHPAFRVLDTAAANAALLGVILIGLSTALNVIGGRWLAAVMNAGVVIELLAAVLLIALLAAHAVRGPGEVVRAAVPADAAGGGVVGALLAGAVMAAYVLYGFDTAGSLAEETERPRRRAPRAILQALAAAGGLGLLLLLAALMSAPSLADPLLGSDAGGLPHLIKQVMGDGLGKVFVGASVVAVFICTLAVQASTARVLFAMARDRAVPGWKRLGRVAVRRQTPAAAAVATGAGGAALLLFNLLSEQAMTALACVSIVWANLAYLLTTAPLLVRRLRTGGRSPLLGRWAVPVNLVAVVWGAVLIVNIAWPRERMYGTDWYLQFGAPLATAGLLLVGALVYRRMGRCG